MVSISYSISPIEIPVVYLIFVNKTGFILQACAINTDNADTVIQCQNCKEILHVRLKQYSITSPDKVTIVDMGTPDNDCCYFNIENMGDLVFHAPKNYFR